MSFRTILYPVALDVSNTVTLELLAPFANGAISAIRSVWIDNATNPAAIHMTVQTTGQTIICPAVSQGMFPVLLLMPSSVLFYSTGGVNVNTILYEEPMPCYVQSGNSHPPPSGSFILTETGGKITLESGSGFIILE